MFLLFIDCSAENNNTYSYIDDAHKEVSQTILDSSGYIDRSLSNWIGDVKSFVYQEENDQKSSLDKDVNAVDSFFKNEKFMDDTDKSFIRIRATSHIQSLGKDQNDVGVKARLSLNKTKKNIRLFIEKDDEEKNIDGTSNNDSAVNLGVSYLTPEYYNISSKYSIGISGFYPYLSARYKIKYEINGWLIEPVQAFKYSLRDEKFEENTNIYFDTKIDQLKFFRVKLFRGTSSDRDGMDYSTSLTYVQSPMMDASFSISQLFAGNTKYKYTDDNSQ